MQDESNDDLRFARNILRHKVLAAAEQGPYPGATEAIVRLGEQAAAVARHRETAIGDLIARAVERRPDGSLLLHRRLSELATGDADLLAGLVLELWRQSDWPRRELSSRHLATVVGMISGGVKGVKVACDLPGGIAASLHPEGVIIERHFRRPAAKPADR